MKIKQLLAFVLCLALFVCLTACGGKKIELPWSLEFGQPSDEVVDVLAGDNAEERQEYTEALASEDLATPSFNVKDTVDLPSWEFCPSVTARDSVEAVVDIPEQLITYQGSYCGKFHIMATFNSDKELGGLAYWFTCLALEEDSASKFSAFTDAVVSELKEYYSDVFGSPGSETNSTISERVTWENDKLVVSITNMSTGRLWVSVDSKEYFYN